MSIKDILVNKKEQLELAESLHTIIDRLKLINPKIYRSQNRNTSEDITDSFSNAKPIPMMSRLKKTRYNGIPKPTRALTAKYRPNVPKPRPASVSAKSFRIKKK
jgi:hypothetical protein